MIIKKEKYIFLRIKKINIDINRWKKKKLILLII